MTTRFEVRCVVINDAGTPYEKVAAIGGKAGDGSYWRLTQRDAIEAIKSGTLSFCVRVRRHLVPLIIGRSPFISEYLKSRDDGDLPMSLLDLPRCPDAPPANPESPHDPA